MKCMCQLQLCIYYHLSFDACDLSLSPRGKSQDNPSAVGIHTKTIDCI